MYVLPELDAYVFDAADYRLVSLKPISQGGNARIFKVVDSTNNTEYAAKILYLEFDNAQNEKNFIREILILMKASHPCVIGFHGFSSSPKFSDPSMQCPTIIMELAENGSIRSKIEGDQKNNPDPNWTNTKRMISLIGIARGMKHLHSKCIIHRDLKPDNVLLNNNYYPKITDFGTSKFQTDNNQSANQSTTFIYMAPEMYDDEYTNAVDVYAFGLTAYEIITSSALYKNEPIPKLITKIMKGFTLNFPADLNPKIVALVNSCISKNPDERPTFSEIAERLENPEYFLTDVDNNEITEYLNYVNTAKDELPLSKEATELLQKAENGEYNLYKSIGDKFYEGLSPFPLNLNEALKSYRLYAHSMPVETAKNSELVDISTLTVPEVVDTITSPNQSQTVASASITKALEEDRVCLLLPPPPVPCRPSLAEEDSIIEEEVPRSISKPKSGDTITSQEILHPYLLLPPPPEPSKPVLESTDEKQIDLSDLVSSSALSELVSSSTSNGSAANLKIPVNYSSPKSFDDYQTILNQSGKRPTSNLKNRTVSLIVMKHEPNIPEDIRNIVNSCADPGELGLLAKSYMEGDKKDYAIAAFIYDRAFAKFGLNNRSSIPPAFADDDLSASSLVSDSPDSITSSELRKTLQRRMTLELTPVDLTNLAQTIQTHGKTNINIFLLGDTESVFLIYNAITYKKVLTSIDIHPEFFSAKKIRGHGITLIRPINNIDVPQEKLMQFIKDRTAPKCPKEIKLNLIIFCFAPGPDSLCSPDMIKDIQFASSKVFTAVFVTSSRNPNFSSKLAKKLNHCKIFESKESFNYDLKKVNLLIKCKIANTPIYKFIQEFIDLLPSSKIF